MLYIPFINRKSTEATRRDYVNELRRAGADRVYIFAKNFYGAEPQQTEELDLLRENVAYYTKAGFEVAVWINGLGHGGSLAHETQTKTADYVRLRGLENAGEAGDSFCPLDTRFTEMYCTFLRRVALTGTKMIMIDDDLRIALHGACKIACACDLHIAEYNKRAKTAGLLTEGESVTREDLAKLLFTGETNAWRKLWLTLQGDTMRNFCSALRKTVDSVDTTIRLGHCACLPTWDLDGTDSIEMSRIFAGGTKPFLRLIAAPYWNNGHYFGTTGLGSIIDLERMEAGWCKRYAPDIEIFSEGDLYTRPRYNTPGIYAEAFDQVLLAEHGMDGILKYMLDYVQDPLYETGYIDRHVYFRPLREELDKAFDGMETAGVYVHEVMHKIAEQDCTGRSETDIVMNFTPASVNFVNHTGLPVSYLRTQYTTVALVFGENAKYLNADTAGLPLILDAYAAEILQAGGTDVGLLGSTPSPAPQAEFFPAENITVTTGTNSGLEKIPHAFRKFTLNAGAKIVSTFDNGNPACYTYENADGLRVLVYAFEADKITVNSPYIRSYPRQRQLFAAVEQIMGSPLPVKVREQPEIFTLARKNETGMSVGIWNFYADMALPRQIELDRDYAQITFLGETKGRLQGNTVFLEKGIFPFGFAGFTVK